jgi:hypothetical protein
MQRDVSPPPSQPPQLLLAQDGVYQPPPSDSVIPSLSAPQPQPIPKVDSRLRRAPPPAAIARRPSGTLSFVCFN